MLPELARTLELLESGFRDLRILVVGDLMLDRYVEGEVERISPEAPVPVLRQAREYARPGGAANVAMNLAGLGCQTFLCGRLGNDADGTVLRGSMAEAQVNTEAVLTCQAATSRRDSVPSGKSSSGRSPAVGL